MKLFLTSSLVSILTAFFLTISNQSHALDDFDLMKYGPDDKIEIKREAFILKFVFYKTSIELDKAFEKVSGTKLENGAGIRGFANVNPIDDVCYVHVIKADIWDNREAMAILGHEVYHCALADHKDAGKVKDPEPLIVAESTEDLIKADEELLLDELEFECSDKNPNRGSFEHIAGCDKLKE